MIVGNKRQLFVNHRNHPELVEALANVKRGTFQKYIVLTDMIPELRKTEYWSNINEVEAARENLKDALKKSQQLRKLHRFMTEGIGLINQSLPGQTKGARKIRKILLDLYFDDPERKFASFYCRSCYVQGFEGYYALVRAVGIYW